MTDTYPGSKRMRRAPLEVPEVPVRVAAPWAEQTHYVNFKGQTIEVFYRGAFALAMNRTLVAIRAMVKKGIIPNPRLTDLAGRYLYTRGQIEDMVSLAIEEGVFDPAKRARFSDRFVEEAWKILSRSAV